MGHWVRADGSRLVGSRLPVPFFWPCLPTSPIFLLAITHFPIEALGLLLLGGGGQGKGSDSAPISPLVEMAGGRGTGPGWRGIGVVWAGTQLYWMFCQGRIPEGWLTPPSSLLPCPSLLWRCTTCRRGVRHDRLLPWPLWPGPCIPMGSQPSQARGEGGTTPVPLSWTWGSHEWPAETPRSTPANSCTSFCSHPTWLGKVTTGYFEEQRQCGRERKTVCPGQGVEAWVPGGPGLKVVDDAGPPWGNTRLKVL